jgi:hypothetical protein
MIVITIGFGMTSSTAARSKMQLIVVSDDGEGFGVSQLFAQYSATISNGRDKSFMPGTIRMSIPETAARESIKLKKRKVSNIS